MPEPEPEWSAVYHRIVSACEPLGLDLVHPFALEATASGAEHPPFGEPGAFAVLVGNTKRLWPRFLAALREDPGLSSAEHPLERYLETRLPGALSAGVGHAHRIHFAHVTEPRALPVQRLSERSGLGPLGPCHLNVHPIHGPWFALRALLVFDLAGPHERGPAPANHCSSCEKPCLVALERALALTPDQPDARSIAAHASAWIAVRDACPVGRESRYESEQLLYHYTQQKRILLEAL